MSTVSHKYIQDRADFFHVLDDAIADTRRLGGGPPLRPPLESILYQLEMMTVWTRNGRQPTKDERRSISIGELVVRELEPAARDDLDEYMKHLYELTFYFKLWWDDAEWAGMDDKDSRVAFPDD
jgi:hypothetical protein